jgi:hypothetical protein
VVAKDHGDLVMVTLDLLDRRINETVPKIDSMHSKSVQRTLRKWCERSPCVMTYSWI